MGLLRPRAKGLERKLWGGSRALEALECATGKTENGYALVR